MDTLQELQYFVPFSGDVSTLFKVFTIGVNGNVVFKVSHLCRVPVRWLPERTSLLGPLRKQVFSYPSRYQVYLPLVYTLLCTIKEPFQVVTGVNTCFLVGFKGSFAKFMYYRPT